MALKPSVVQIAGLGLVTPFGWGYQPSWAKLLQNQSASRCLTLKYPDKFGVNNFRTIGAPLMDADPILLEEIQTSLNNRKCRTTPDNLRSVINIRENNRTNRSVRQDFNSDIHSERNCILNNSQSTNSQLAMMFAVNEAIEDARIDLNSFEPHRIGCVIGSSKGDWGILEREFENVHGRPPFHFGWPDGPGSYIADLLNLRGPLITPVAACATGLLAIARGAELINHGTCDIVIAGAVDCSLNPLYISSFRKLGVLNEDEIQPESALKPFDTERKGFVTGEGAGALILVNSETCGVGLKTYGFWRGHHHLAETSSSVSMSLDSPTLPKLLEMTLERSRCTRDEIDFINLHGTGTRLNDLCESHAVSRVFAGNKKYRCNGNKGAIGHTLGAAGMIETAFSLLTMKHQIIPATTNCRIRDSDIALPIVQHEAVKHDIKAMLKLSAGFGGHVVAGVISREEK